MGHDSGSTRLLAVMLLLAVLALAGVSTGGLTCLPDGTTETQITPTPPPATPTPPATPQLKLLKVSGTGAKSKFRVKVQWNGEEPTFWKVKRWTVMRDLTNQTQSMLVVEEQAFEIQPGEPRNIDVRGVCINPTLPPARQLLVDYPGAPQYVLTNEIPVPAVKQVIATIMEVEAALPAMMPRLRFKRNTVELVQPRPREESYLGVVVWDQSVSPPLPHLDQNVVEAAVVVAAAGGMTVAEYSTHLQRSVPGSSSTDTTALAREVADQVNKLLGLANLSARLTTR